MKTRMVGLFVALVLVLAMAAQASAAKVTGNLIQDLDASVNVSTSGSNVTSWAPVGGVGDTLTTSTGTPILNSGVLNGHDTIAFTLDQMNGTDTSLFDFGSGDLTWFAVVNYATTSGNNTNVFGTLENSGGFDGIELDRSGNNMSARFRTDGGPDPIIGGLTDTRGAWHIYTGRRNGATAEFYIDGVPQNTAAVNANTISSDALAVGAERTGGGERANFDIAYLAFYNTSLSDGFGGGLNEMGTYLADRYGLSTAYNFVAGATVMQVIKFDFENANLGDTTQTNFFHVVSGTAFDSIVDGTASQPVPYNLLDGSTATEDSINPYGGGDYLIRTDFAVNPAGTTLTKPGDGPTGVIETDAFALPSGADVVGLTLGADMAGNGGMIELIRDSDDAVLATLDAALQSLTLTHLSIDILAFAGESVYLRITDDSSGSWGHIAVDNILIEKFTSSNAAVVPTPAALPAGLALMMAMASRRRRPNA